MNCVVFIATSLDGYIARKDGGLDWLTSVERPGEDYGYKVFADSVDVLITGRGTYDTVLAFPTWPYAGKRVIVLTHGKRESRHGEEFFSGDPRELLQKLEREGVKRAYVDGGKVIQSFLAAGLIDELTISIIPVLLGSGIPLFAPELPELKLKLEQTRGYESGLVQVRYSVVRG